MQHHARDLRSGTNDVGVAFTPDGTQLATTTTDEVMLWDTASWSLVRRVADPSHDQGGGLVVLPEPNRTLTFTPDGKTLIDNRRAGVRALAIDTGDVRWEQPSDNIGGTSVALSGDGHLLALEDLQNRIHLLDPMTGRAIGAPLGGELFSTAVVFSRDGAALFAPSDTRPVIAMWSLDGRSPISRVVGRPGQGSPAYSPSGRLLLTARAGLSVVAPAEVWDAESGRHVASVPDAAFPTLVDDHTVAGFFVDELAVDHLDLRSNRFVGPRVSVPLTGVVNAGVDSEGRFLVAHDDGTITQYAPSGTMVGHPWVKIRGLPFTVALSSKAGLGIVHTGAGALAFRLADGTRAVPNVSKFVSSSFSPDGKLVGGLTSDSRLVVLNTRTGAQVGPALPVSGSQSGVMIGGTRLLAGISQDQAQLYDFATRVPIGDPIASTSYPSLRPDGRQLATSGTNGISLWDLDPDHWERAACRVAGRNLTRAEWAQYFPNGGAYRATCPGF